MQTSTAGEWAPGGPGDGAPGFGQDFSNPWKPKKEVREVGDLQRDFPSPAVDRPEYEARLDAEPLDLRARLVASLERRVRGSADGQAADPRPVLGGAPRTPQPLTPTALAIDVVANTLERRRVEQGLEALFALQEQRGGDLSD
jgi:hypothetical protein